MKYTSLAIIATVSAVKAFAPSANQRQLVSKVGGHNAAVRHSQSTSLSSAPMTMNIPGILGAGFISLGLLGFSGEPSSSVVSISSTVSSVVVSSATMADDNQSPVALKEAEKKLAEEVKRAEREAKKDAKVSYIDIG